MLSIFHLREVPPHLISGFCHKSATVPLKMFLQGQPPFFRRIFRWAPATSAEISLHQIKAKNNLSHCEYVIGTERNLMQCCLPKSTDSFSASASAQSFPKLQRREKWPILSLFYSCCSEPWRQHGNLAQLGKLHFSAAGVSSEQHKRLSLMLFIGENNPREGGWGRVCARETFPFQLPESKVAVE